MLRARFRSLKRLAKRWLKPISADHLDKLLRLDADLQVGKVLQFDYPPSYDLRPRWGATHPCHRGLTDLFNRFRGDYLRTLQEMTTLAPWFQKIPQQFSHDAPGVPGWVGGPINALDTALLYYYVWKHRPRTYLEIGSGITTLFAARAKHDHQLATRILSIDPNPRAAVDAVCDEVIRQPMEVGDLAIFHSLEPGDIVFMDGSHRTFMNSDVTVFMLDVLPLLKPGVIIHFHDIHLPYDYPDMFVNWYWSEQYILAAYLLGASEKLRMLMPSRFVSDFPELTEIMHPLTSTLGQAGQGWLNGGSLWFTHQ